MLEIKLNIQRKESLSEIWRGNNIIAPQVDGGVWNAFAIDLLLIMVGLKPINCILYDGCQSKGV